MLLKGRVWKYEDNIDTDVIIPGRYCHLSDPHEIAKHCFEDIDSEFVKKISPGDLIFAGNNFGCGSSREHAPLAIKFAGISAVIARSFARIFYRNAINIGLPIFECPLAVENTSTGDLVEVDIQTGLIKNLTKGTEFKATPFPEFIMQIINAGGLMPYLKKLLQEGKNEGV